MPDEEPVGSGEGSAETDESGEPELPPIPPLPELPEVPDLPKAPELKPTLPPRPSRYRPTKESEDYRQMGIAYYLPATLIAPIVVLTVLGWFLDDHFHKSPDFTLAGALLGTVVGFINMFRLASRLNK